MTESSNRKDSKPQQPESTASASSTTSEPLQLDLFESLERLTGDQWGGEAPDGSKPNRDFILPPASALAADLKPTDSSRASAQSASAQPSKSEGGDHG
jgi:hypothetical protein